MKGLARQAGEPIVMTFSSAYDHGYFADMAARSSRGRRGRDEMSLDTVRAAGRIQRFVRDGSDGQKSRQGERRFEEAGLARSYDVACSYSMGPPGVASTSRSAASANRPSAGGEVVDGRAGFVYPEIGAPVEDWPGYGRRMP